MGLFPNVRASILKANQPEPLFPTIMEFYMGLPKKESLGEGRGGEGKGGEGRGGEGRRGREGREGVEGEGGEGRGGQGREGRGGKGRGGDRRGGEDGEHPSKSGIENPSECHFDGRTSAHALLPKPKTIIKLPNRDPYIIHLNIAL